MSSLDPNWAPESGVPTQSEPPFAIAQGIVLLAFLALGIAAAKKFHPGPGVQPPKE